MSRFNFWGENALAYNSRETEILLSGPAGTGKSVVLLAKCLTLLDKYPGCRGLFCRGTRVSLTQSGMVTFEDDVLGSGHSLLINHPIQRHVRRNYVLPNGSEFVIAGLDDPGKTLSAQYDFIYIQEATEEGITFAVYETLLRSLRNRRIPYQQIFMDCNPTTPVSWLFKRSASGGLLKRYNSTHRDNPAFWDRDKGEWTEDGKSYLEKLQRMSGARLARFYTGQWQVSEGLVYDGFREDVHMLPHGWKVDPYWPQSWSIDWGDRAPTVVLVWAHDPDGRLYLIREYYQTHTRSDVMGKMLADAMGLGELKRPISVVADHNEEKAYLFGIAAGVHVDKADKVDRDKGIQQTQSRFDIQEDGKPRIFFARDARKHDTDTSLADDGLPTSLYEEICGYTWNPKADKDEPIEKNDHAADAMRYEVRWADANGPGTVDAFAAANAPRLGKRITDSLRPGTFRR